MRARRFDHLQQFLLAAIALGLGCQAVEPPRPDPDLELRKAGDKWLEGATARAYDVEYDVVKGRVLSVRERAVDPEAHAAGADAAEEFFGSTEHTEMPWTQMRVDYELDGVARNTIASLVSTIVAEDFLADVSKGYGAVNEPMRVVRFSLQVDRALTLGDTIAIELQAPKAFGTRTHHLGFTAKNYVVDESDIGQTKAPLRRADGGDAGATNECGLLEVFPDYNIVDDENRIDLVFIGVQDSTPFRIEDYLVGMLDIYDERAVMELRDDGGSPNERRGVFGLAPFAGNHHLFNFWFLAEPLQLADIIDDPDEKFCTDKLDDEVSDCFDGARELRVYMGTELECRGTRSGDRVVIDADPADPYLRTGTLSHELGHMVFDLADEYTEEDLGDSPKFPNCLDEGEEDRAAELEYPTCSTDAATRIRTSGRVRPRSCAGARRSRSTSSTNAGAAPCSPTAAAIRCAGSAAAASSGSRATTESPTAAPMPTVRAACADCRRVPGRVGTASPAI